MPQLAITISYEIVLSILLSVIFIVLLFWMHQRRSSYDSVENISKSTTKKIVVPTGPVKREVESIESKKETSADGISRSPSYHMDEEQIKSLSSEYSSRGRIWSSRPNWQLSKAPRLPINNSLSSNRLEHVLSLLQAYDIDPIRGFLPFQDPLQRLPYTRYHLWEDLADDLPKLLCARLGQARDPLKQLPVLKIDKLATNRELRRAHLLLSLFAHAFVWGGNEPLDYIPEGIAKPLMEVSEKLGIPPVLGHPSIILYNWRRFDIHGDVCMENLCTLNNFFDGRDENWFYLITVEIEAKGAASILPMMLAIDAVSRYNEEKSQVPKAEKYKISTRSDDIGLPIGGGDEDETAISGLRSISSNEELSGELSSLRVAYYVTLQLRKIAQAIKQMCSSLSAMKEGCHPFIFYHRVRPFLSGWKHNPTLPNGVIYQGCSESRYQYFGGSAAQSSLIPLLDIGLGISHDSTRSKEFLLAMREYMVQPHREFLKYLETISCIRDYVMEILLNHGIQYTDIDTVINAEKTSDIVSSHPYYQYWIDLRDAYDSCVEEVRNFRTGHIGLVADYIMVQQKKNSDSKKVSIEKAAGGKGTGGTDLMKFLKPIRDNCEDSLLSSRATQSCDEQATPKEGENIIHIKDNGDFEDIDLYRGGFTHSLGTEWS